MDLLLQLFRSYAAHYVELIIVFLVLFGLTTYLFARGRFVPMLRGFGGMIALFISCPFVYLRAAVLSMADYGEKSETADASSKQYLLNKLMLFMQAVLVVASIAVFSASVTDGWNSMLPPQMLRFAIRELDKTVATKKAELLKLEPAVGQLDAAWKGQRDAEMTRFTTERSMKIEQLVNGNSELAVRINSVDPQTKMLFTKVEEFHARNAGDMNADELARTMNKLNDYLDRFTFTDDAKAMIKSYNDNWGLNKRLRTEINNMSEREVRAGVQQAYEDMSAQLAELRQKLPIQEKTLAGLRAEATYDVKSLLLSVLYGIFKFILLVWLFGLIIEVLWSAINVSTDVKKIQDSVKPS